MFSKNYNGFDKEVKDILTDITLPNIQETKEILEKSKYEKLSLKETAKLLEIGKHENTEEQFNLIREFVNSEFRGEENTLKHIIPVYLSSYCVDTCGYCNYSAKKNVERTRLNLSQLEEEVKHLIEQGHKVIEFTLATDPRFTPEKLAKYISKTKELLGDEKGSGVLLCSDHFSREEYEFLKQSGLWGIIQWDETLNKEKYEKWHKNSPRKSDFYERISNHDRAIQAGLQVGTGCLFGLSDYRYDVLMQIAKARHLEKEYGTKQFVFGTPRLKAIGDKVIHSKDEVSDKQYELALMVYKIAESGIARWLQTRETPELNLRNVMNGDIYTFECGEVKPGGYKANRDIINSLDGQFKVNEMTRNQFERELQNRNFKVNYAWIKNI